MTEPQTEKTAQPLAGRTIVLGVTGSIAAYKAAEIVRRLTELGADVHVTATRGGLQFVTAVTLRTLSANPVITDMFEDPSEWDVQHISLASRADAVLIAPASANAIAKLAHGIADEFLYTLALATRGPLLIAPAMNTRMYEHPATQANLELLRSRGAHIIDPEAGWLACREVGRGRLADPECLVAAVVELLAKGDLAGLRVLVTAGPTRERQDGLLARRGRGPAWRGGDACLRPHLPARSPRLPGGARGDRGRDARRGAGPLPRLRCCHRRCGPG